jgi:hypothetical protein
MWSLPRPEVAARHPFTGGVAASTRKPGGGIMILIVQALATAIALILLALA